MDSRTLISEIYSMDDFNMIDAPARTVSPPLLKRNGDEVKVVFFVHIYSDTEPTDYIVCDLDGGNLRYLSADETYALFSMRREDILTTETSDDDLPTCYDTGRSPEDRPDELYDRFDKAAFGDTIDWEAYRDYVRELITYSDIAGKRYLKAFMEYEI